MGLGAQAEAEVENNMWTLIHCHILFCTMTCTIVKELTHSLLASHNKHVVEFVEKLAYFYFHNDTLAHS